MFIPLSKDDQLLKGDENSPTAIITLWTRKEEVRSKVDARSYCVIGQLYSAERGIDILVRNLLANPEVTNLIITGKDLASSGQALYDFFTSGFMKGKTRQGRDCWKIRSASEGYIGRDISKEDLDMLRDHIHVVRLGIDEIDSFRPKSMPAREKRVYPAPETTTIDYGGEDSAYLVREDSVHEAWLRILDLVMKFGKVTRTQFDSLQKEVIDIVSVITSEDPNAPVIPPYFPFDAAHFEEYKTRFLTDKRIDGVSYTYGNRMRGFFGNDQIEMMIQKLRKDLDSRQAVVTLWDGEKDIEGKESPCLNHLWVRVRQNKVFMSATLRSNDMYSGYPENALALRLLQEKIRSRLSYLVFGNLPDHEFGLGDLVIVSHSAHIYEESWKASEEVIRAHYSPRHSLDRRGAFFIRTDQNKKLIYVDFLSAAGEKITTFSGNSALRLRDVLVRENVVGTPAHGIYLGIQLCKAQRALREGRAYVQDSEDHP